MDWFPPAGESLLLLAAAMLAGAMNAVAGGGTFFLFPALVFTGLPPVLANATCSVAVWPGAMASAWAYRREMTEPRPRAILPPMIAIALLGGAIGALWLLAIPEKRFEQAVPWLLLGATALFALGKQFVPRLSSLVSLITNTERRETSDEGRKIYAYAFQFFIAVYGGFFGAGIGILNLAMLQMLGMQNIHAMNGLKTILGAAINATAVFVFVIAGVVAWPEAAVTVAGAVIGGYWGAKIALRVPQAWLRRFVIAAGLLMSAYFFRE